MNLMRRYKYQYTTADSQGEFTIDQYSESIANAEAKMTVARRVNPSSLLSFNLVCVGAAS
jgi:hypothetical protein